LNDLARTLIGSLVGLTLTLVVDRWISVALCKAGACKLTMHSCAVLASLSSGDVAVTDGDPSAEKAYFGPKSTGASSTGWVTSSKLGASATVSCALPWLQSCLPHVFITCECGYWLCHCSTAPATSSSMTKSLRWFSATVTSPSSFFVK
jgi:hypothetical protein